MNDAQAPGPGWTLADDGHWRPPPFELDSGLPPTSGGGGAPEGKRRRRRKERAPEDRPARDRSRATAGAKRLGRTAAGGVLGLACLVGAVAAGNSVYHGVKADEAEAATTTTVEARQRYQGVTTADAWAGIGDPGRVCPSAAEVAATTGTDEEPLAHARDETTRVNGVPLYGARCNYGEHVHVGAATLPGDLVTWLEGTTGDYAVEDGPLTAPSVRLVEPPDPGVRGRGAGSVRIVFQAGDRAYWITVDTALEDEADALAALVAARLGTA